MKVLILGASGIIGQHMRLCVPPEVQPVFCRRKSDSVHISFDLSDTGAVQVILENHKPDVIVNLAGENNTDAVERNPQAARAVNVEAVREIAAYCQRAGAHLVQVSTQAVFRGDRPPYAPESNVYPANEYGHQKRLAEGIAAGIGATIVRPTFILGIRPLPHVGRPNPMEQILAGQSPQVNDRFFSPLFARDAAAWLWHIATGPRRKEPVHLGIPRRTSRYEIAAYFNGQAEACSHGDFAGLAPRPVDTTYTGSWFRTDWHQGLEDCRREWKDRQTLSQAERAREIALFLSIREDAAYARLHRGFHAAHADVAHDFRKANPQTDDDLLRWYRTTEAYIYELAAYHADPGFNYSGMCRGIADRLQASGAKKVLCLGDGIGDLTLALQRAGIGAIYHDLAGSRTAAFAVFRYERLTGQTMPRHLTSGWAPELANGSGSYDAVISIDFMEHVTDLPAWAGAIRDTLVPGGLAMFQNAFACGSGNSGSIPMHLSRNDRYEKEWNPLLASLGFSQQSSNWYIKAA